MSKPQPLNALFAMAVFAALVGMLWAVDREVTQGKVTEYLAYFR